MHNVAAVFKFSSGTISETFQNRSFLWIENKKDMATEGKEAETHIVRGCKEGSGKRANMHPKSSQRWK